MDKPSDYESLQTEKYLSHEEDIARWRDGQIRFLDQFFLPDIFATATVFDAGSGDGTGLQYLKSKGYDAEGCDLSFEKVERARSKGLLVTQADVHDLFFVRSDSFDVVYSSHALEHCYDPVKATSELKRIAKPGGHVIIVLPYPDTGPPDAHCGSNVLGTRPPDDGGARVTQWFLDQGLHVVNFKFDDYREPEIWLMLKKP